MNITITINTDSTAFDDNEEPEVARMLQQFARELLAYGPEALEDFNGAKLRDVNGNTVGKVVVE